MDLNFFYEYCMTKVGVTEHYPFDEETLVFKVGGKMFALSSLKEWEKGTPSVNLKCHPDSCVELRIEFDSIQPGWHMNKTHWNTIYFNKEVSDKMIVELIDQSYGLVFKNLTKKLQETLLNK